MAEVFISHAAADVNIASRIRNELENAGIKTWLDKFDLRPGDNAWEEKITESLKHATMGIVLLSSAALNSPSVAQQYQYLLAQNKPLYVATVEQVEPKRVPHYLQPLQSVDLTHDVDSGVAKLTQAIQSDIQHPGQAARARRTKPRTMTLTVEVDSDEIEVAELMSKIEHLLESDVQQIRLVSVEPESDVFDPKGNTRPVD